MKSFVLALVALIVTAGILSASEIREIELTDGSVITGEVVSLSGGVYTVRSSSLGTIRIEESRVRAIRMRGSSDTGGGTEGGIRSLQEKMMSNEEIMSMIRSLGNDPEFQAILQDPEIMTAVRAGNISALIANPRFMKLLDNKTLRDIQNKMGK